MDLNDATNVVSDNLDTIVKVLVMTGIGLLGYSLLKYSIEPWVIETVCRELIKCD